jgi:site-specific DNA recombinase
MEIEPSEAEVVRRIFEEYASGKSPRQIAADLNAEGIPAPRPRARGSKRGSGHWKANTIYGNRARGTGILNNELYIGQRVWNRLRYGKDPETGNRKSKVRSRDEWMTAEQPELRIIDQALWDTVKSRQDAVEIVRTAAEAEGKRGAGAAQAARRRKYLLSGLLTCGQCGGNMTVAGKGERRRYYCANAKEKGHAVCTGMPGLLERDAASSLVSGLRDGLMKDDAYKRFAQQMKDKLKAGQSAALAAVKAHDRKIRELQKRHDALLDAVANGKFSESVIDALNEAADELKTLKAEREGMEPAPIELPENLPELYRRYVDDLATTLMDDEVSGAAADELHDLIDRVLVNWEPGIEGHTILIEGKLLEILAKAKPALRAGLEANGRSLKLVAGVGFEPTTFRL